MKKAQQNSRFNAGFKSLFFIYLVTILLLAGCKKEQTLANASESELSSQPSIDMSYCKPDIIVHAGESIQKAVDAAKPGMIIRIEPGIYKEAVLITKARIKLIGVTTSKGDHVIIKNPGDEENGITATETADGFLLKDVTVRDFEENGVLLIGVNNFTISHVTAINNGEYGIFPVLSSRGIIEFCTASGHSDTGIYVGQSSDVRMEHNEAFANVNGLEVENSTNVYVANNKSHNNVAGILVDLLPGKDVKTSSNVQLCTNRVYNNNHKNFGEPGSLESFVPKGIGILVLGTDQTTVRENTVTGNDFAGIIVFSSLVLGQLAGIPPEAFADIEPNPDGARIIKNVLHRNGAAPPKLPIPLPGVDLLWDGSGQNNCWSNNIFQSSYPSPLPKCN